MSRLASSFLISLLKKITIIHFLTPVHLKAPFRHSPMFFVGGEGRNSFHFLPVPFYFFLLLGFAFFALFQVCLSFIFPCIQSRCEAMQALNQVPIAAEIICGDHWPMMRKHLFDVFSDTDPQLSVSHGNHIHLVFNYFSLSLSLLIFLPISLLFNFCFFNLISLNITFYILLFSLNVLAPPFFSV